VNYFGELEIAKEKIVRVLEAKRIRAALLKFGGAGEVPQKQTLPTDARSEFLANRAMGDWAENVLAEAIDQTIGEWRAVHYGNSDSIAAGEPGFKAHYLAVADEVRMYGKRPDLLIFPAAAKVPDSLSPLKFDQVDQIVAGSIGAIEVRSSKFKAINPDFHFPGVLLVW